ncbi:hypothetical protein DH2020_018929 [Rehmannia glutinosa]|uniref:BHLH domain-containing protein n=1 Tax=Rehmannia glutinosa TaxID=99300 RepID=A0ABR0WNW0_REHGL
MGLLDSISGKKSFVPIKFIGRQQLNLKTNERNQSTKLVSSGSPPTNNEASVVSVTNKNSYNNNMDSSSIVTDKYDSCDQLTQKPINNPMDKKRKSKEGFSANSAQSKVRREKISERMKLLQAIVPGCDKVTGKALMLDEIINYVQSLQNQVEFLSMKLASMNPMFYDFGMDLESFMVRPDQDLSNMPSALPNMQECSPATPNNNYNHLLDNSANSILFQQAQIPNVLPQPAIDARNKIRR